jgi:hypothetical protein
MAIVHRTKRKSDMTLNQAPAISRPLGALEKLFWLADQNRPTHFAIAAEVGGSTGIEQWQDALDRVCRQSALIWSRIVPDKHGAPVFMPVPYGSIPLDVVENAMSEWTDHVAGELRRPFDTSSAPLLRAKLLHGADRSVIILCVHHSVADALALSFLMCDVLRRSPANRSGSAPKPRPSSIWSPPGALPRRCPRRKQRLQQDRRCRTGHWTGQHRKWRPCVSRGRRRKRCASGRGSSNPRSTGR